MELLHFWQSALILNLKCLNTHTYVNVVSISFSNVMFKILKIKIKKILPLLFSSWLYFTFKKGVFIYFDREKDRVIKSNPSPLRFCHQCEGL